MKQTPSSRHSSAQPSGRSGSGLRHWLSRYWPLVLAGALVSISLYVRYATVGMTNSDMEAKVLVWYAKLQRHGPLVGLGKDFYNYTPPYVYLLALATLTSSFLAPLTAVKIIALVFDILTAGVVLSIVRLQRPRGYLPILAAAIFFTAPTFLINSAVWGQADSTFALFALGCVYFLLVEKSFFAVALAAIALAVKPQGVFLFPLLLLMMLWRRVRWWHLFAVPVVYGLCMAPAVAMGRTWYEVFTAYTSQAGAGKALTHNAANIYVFVPRDAYSWLLWPAVIGAVLVFLAWIYWSWRSIRQPDAPTIVLLALVCMTLVPFLLPNMRERYYYLADVLSVILAFMVPVLWYLPVLFQVLSMLSYSMFLWGSPQTILQAAALISLFTLILLVRHQAMLADRQASLMKGRDPGGPEAAK